MYAISALVATLAFSKQQRTTWVIDGNNLLGHRGTPRNPKVLAQNLERIQGAERVILVLDGTIDYPETCIDEKGRFQCVQLQNGQSADDYIACVIQSLPCISRRKVQVVTADRQLRRRVLAQPLVRSVVNPVTFWRRYQPRLSGIKNNNKQQKVDS